MKITRTGWLVLTMLALWLTGCQRTTPIPTQWQQTLERGEAVEFSTGIYTYTVTQKDGAILFEEDFVSPLAMFLDWWAFLMFFCGFIWLAFWCWRRGLREGNALSEVMGAGFLVLGFVMTGYLCTTHKAIVDTEAQRVTEIEEHLFGLVPMEYERSLSAFTTIEAKSICTSSDDDTTSTCHDEIRLSPMRNYVNQSKAEQTPTLVRYVSYFASDEDRRREREYIAALIEELSKLPNVLTKKPSAPKK